MGNPVSGFSFNTNGSVARGATGASAGIYSHARLPVQWRWLETLCRQIVMSVGPERRVGFL